MTYQPEDAQVCLWIILATAVMVVGVVWVINYPFDLYPPSEHVPPKKFWWTLIILGLLPIMGKRIFNRILHVATYKMWKAGKAQSLPYGVEEADKRP